MENNGKISWFDIYYYVKTHTYELGAKLTILDENHHSVGNRVEGFGSRLWYSTVRRDALGSG